MTSGIHKIYRAESAKFVALPNWVVRSPEYSANSFRLLAYLLSHEDGYGLTYAQIERQTGMGRFAINEAIKLLTSLAWLEVWQPKGEDGRFAAKSWLIKNPGVGDSATEPFRYGTANALKEDNSLEKTTEEENLNARVEEEFLKSFNQFWELYPKKIDKGRAVKDFRSALKRASFESIIAGVKAYKDDPYRKPQFTKYPSSWLNADAWENFITSSEARVATEERRTKDLAYKDQFLADQRSQEALSAPAPKCQHGNTIALCRRCLS